MDNTVGTKDQILDAADLLMGRIGFRKMTVEDVAREAGVSRRTIYLYFSSKEELGLSSIGRVVREVHLVLEDLVAQDIPSPEKLRAALIQRVMSRVMAVQDYASGLDELFEVIRPTYMARRQAFFEREVELFMKILKQGEATGEFVIDDTEMAARNLILATNAFLPYSLSVRELGTPESVENRLESMVYLLLNGILRAPQYAENQ